MQCQGDLDIISHTLHAAGMTIAVGIAMACQSDSEGRETLGEFGDDNKRNIMKTLAKVAHPYLIGWRSTIARRALARSASDESDMAVPSSSGREYDGVTQGENVRFHQNISQKWGMSKLIVCA